MSAPTPAQDGEYRVASASVPACPWQDISTAPKDGTRIIGLGPVPRYGDVEARETRWEFYGKGSIAKERFDRGEGPSGAWGWHEPIHNWGSSWEPTHWMPLPPPPDATQNKGPSHV